MRLKLKDNNGLHELDVQRKGEKLTAQIDDKSIELEINELPNSRYIIKSGDRIIRGYAIKKKDYIFIHINGCSWNFKDVTNEDVSVHSAGGDGDNKIVSPMPGSVIKILVNEGDKVELDQPLVIVEAMKMENEVHSQMNGIVDKVLVESGQQVGFGELLIELAPLSETSQDE